MNIPAYIADLPATDVYYQKQVETGHFFDQIHESHIEKIIDSVALKVGNKYSFNLDKLFVRRRT